VIIYNYRQIGGSPERHHPKSHRTFKGEGFLGFPPLGGMTTPQTTAQPAGSTRVMGEGTVLADGFGLEHLVVEYNS